MVAEVKRVRSKPVPAVIAIGKHSMKIEGMAAAQNETSVIGSTC